MIDDRFVRTALLLKEEGVQNLENATVEIVGLGGVGGYALEALARAGVGHLILVDFDQVDISNINRQILALETTLKRKKTDVAKERVLSINPNCVVETKDVFVSTQNLNEIFEGQPDFVVDAMDSIKEKCAMMQFLYDHHIPFISAMGAAMKTDISSLKISKLSETRYCAMAKKIRKTLKSTGVDISKIKCVSSFEQQKNEITPMINQTKEQKAALGSLVTMTAMMGLMLAHEVILSLAKGKK